LVQRGSDWAGPQPPRALLDVPNVTTDPSTASVPITLLLYNGPLLWGFNVPIKELKYIIFYVPNIQKFTFMTTSYYAILFI